MMRFIFIFINLGNSFYDIQLKWWHRQSHDLILEYNHFSRGLLAVSHKRSHLFRFLVKIIPYYIKKGSFEMISCLFFFFTIKKNKKKNKRNWFSSMGLNRVTATAMLVCFLQIQTAWGGHLTDQLHCKRLLSKIKSMPLNIDNFLGQIWLREIVATSYCSYARPAQAGPIRWLGSKQA